MIQLKSPNLAARALAFGAQLKYLINAIVFGQSISQPAQPVPGVDRVRKFETEAIVEEEIQPFCAGRVHYQATSWPARSDREVTIAIGQIVQVVGMDNITLLVKPVE